MRYWAILLLPVLWFTAAAAQESRPPSVGDVLARLGYTAEDEKALLAGKIITTDIQRVRDDQLIAAAAILLPGKIEQLHAAARAGNNLSGDPGILALGILDAGGDSQAWQDLTFGAGEQEEAGRLQGFRGGSDFNLSTEEIEALKASLKDVRDDDPALIERTSGAYREILKARHEAYLAAGLEGIAPYRQGGTTLDPGAELGAVRDQAGDFLATFFPDFGKAFAGYPTAPAAEVAHGHYWLKREVEGRPAFVLAHQMVAGGPDHVLLTLREYFVGHTYESLQVIALALPVEQGSVVFYVNSAFTEQITGFFSGVAQSVGQGRMKDDLTEYFETVKRGPAD